ncbi:hypothetical protein H8F16_06830 [Vibrio fluvialis]|uniref:hypothetical protein n=1 Tax=Vibrio fluvialis TaxID=676 RepID=UPI0013027A14|nr:hypothetical protein [Vibrio fluvialis]MBL4246815.1 hypothetical protein [Vibrio fluvialis]MBL4255641.1 hypothetical protein [Vibrio fluvialis]MBY7789429.1 hypothetical protein [Vibrio fluvialis]MBY7794389.1 hypothetical protein [Vibrio fluvialis]MBY7980913.1 hypothetical protein [Vibrio fluvialis]
MKQLNQIHFHPLAPALRTISFISLFLLVYLTLPISVMLAEQFSQFVYQGKLQCSGRTALNKPTPHNGKDREAQ